MHMPLQTTSWLILATYGDKWTILQGYLAHKKTPTPLGPP